MTGMQSSNNVLVNRVSLDILDVKQVTSSTGERATLEDEYS